MSENQGSYDYSNFEIESTELERLKLQANIATATEQQVLIKHGLKENHNVLDIGCGPGFISQIIAKVVGSKGTVHGIDMNLDLLKVANEEIKKTDLKHVQFGKGDIYDLSALRKKFDFVYCRFIFQHLDQPEKALASIYSVLNPGGRVLIVDVDDGWLSLYPKNETYEHIIERQRNYQKEAGGDRLIGRKLYKLFSEANFKEINPDIQIIDSNMVGMPQFLNISTGYKVIFLNKNQDEKISQEAVDNMIKECSQPGYYGAAGIFCFSGMK